MEAELAAEPLDRALLAAFAELTKAGGTVLSPMWCGPGQVTAAPHCLGLDAFGIVYYSIIHIPWERRSDVFDEFHRVLVPGGPLMLVFQLGDDQGHRADAFGKAVCVDWYRQQPDEITGLLRRAGFEVRATTTRRPDSTEKTPQGYVLARKPVAAS
ncbi:class I SAM-dependent methyltransferase [Streptomyces tauricus]|uniref:class I SAM-dependent methyltransferase n=1 Tax=Streptomyces tauricus TaxID=68274 RepID=UPI0033BA83BB